MEPKEWPLGAEQAREDKLAALEASCEKPGPTELFAVVNADGTLVRGLHAVSATKLATGTYEVVFSRDVTHGAFVACIGNSNPFPFEFRGFIATAPRFANPNGILVITSAFDLSTADRGFHLTVLCPQGFAGP
jgi:hypothetical protein